MTVRFALDVDHSLTGRPWRWRGPEPAGSCGPLIDDLLRARGCPHEALDRERTPTIRGFMPDPSVFQDMDRAAERLAAAVVAGEAITIFGDYDVDGATSAALLVRLLRDLGLEAGVYIPDRLMEGYGPSGEALVALARQGSSLVVTVDCGAQAFTALEAAREAGLDVIVVDYHKCARLVREPAGTAPARFAGSCRARHGGGCRADQGAEPCLCRTRAQGHGPARQYRPQCPSRCEPS